MGKNNNRYDEEFKTGAVAMVVEKGRSMRTVASDLGISEPTLRRWVKANTEPVDEIAQKIAELEAENKKLKKELNDAKDTVDILKKSVAIFIEP